MNRGKLYFTIGLPRSGKSILCNEWCRGKFNIKNGKILKTTNEQIEPIIITNPRVVVCSDNIRLATYGQRWWTPGEELVHAIQRVMIVSLLDRGHDVIVDGTHTTEKSILRMLEIDSNADFLFIDTDVQTCKQRAAETNQQDLNPIIDRMQLNIGQLLRYYMGLNTTQKLSSVINYMRENVKKRQQHTI